VKDAAFCVFYVFIILCPFLLIFSRNMVYSVFCYMATVFGVSGIYYLLGLKFFFCATLLINSLAASLLFLILVYSCPSFRGNKAFRYSNRWLSAGLVAIMLFFLLLIAFGKYFMIRAPQAFPYSDFTAIKHSAYNNKFAFALAVGLLFALIGGITFLFIRRRKD